MEGNWVELQPEHFLCRFLFYCDENIVGDQSGSSGDSSWPKNELMTSTAVWCEPGAARFKASRRVGSDEMSTYTSELNLFQPPPLPHTVQMMKVIMSRV